MKLQPLTNIGDVTARILGFNDSDRLYERKLLINQNKYPHSAARKRIETSNLLYFGIQAAQQHIQRREGASFGIPKVWAKA